LMNLSQKTHKKYLKRVADYIK